MSYKKKVHNMAYPHQWGQDDYILFSTKNENTIQKPCYLFKKNTSDTKRFDINRKKKVRDLRS